MLNVIEELTSRSDTAAQDWEYGNGPTTGVGVEYWVFNDKAGLEAYVCVDQGKLITCEINAKAES